MRAKELREALEDVADDIEIVVRGHDHTFRPILAACPNKSEIYKRRGRPTELLEYHGKRNMTDQNAEVVGVIVLE